MFELADREFRAIRDATSDELEHAKAIYPEIEEESKTVAQDSDGRNGELRDIRPGRYAPLNAFNFLRIAQHFFPGFEFEPHKIDGFTQEIISFKPDISRGKFNFYLREMIGAVKRFQAEFEKAGDTMNPFTIIRHCLFAGDRDVFSSILTDAARERFEAWLTANP